jgi:3-hydroxyisobutyrate dehydrogenase-like beta-hydroxyacid dehydrogenase
MQTIGFIGVGRIGTEIAKHLLAAGYEVLGYRRGSLAEFEKLGGTAAASAAAIGERTDIIFSCLPGGDSLDDVVNGPRGLVHSAKAGQIVVELGSHPLPVKERQIERLAAKGAIFLDGEVSGTPGMVAQRKAPIYLAGDADACRKIEPIVKSFTELYLYFGPFGAASKIKFINNLLVTVNTAAIGEAVALALKAGVEPDLMIKAISSGSGGSVLFPIRAPRMVNRNYLPAQGTFELLSHYFDYIDDLAARTQASTPLFDLAADLFRRGIERGLAQHDVAAIIEVVEEISSQEKEKAKIKASA